MLSSKAGVPTLEAASEFSKGWLKHKLLHPHPRVSDSGVLSAFLTHSQVLLARGVGKPWQTSQTSLPLRTQKRGLRPPRPTGRGSLLVGVLFALFNEGNGFRSKAVGHFIRSQGDPENILVVAVVILGDKKSGNCPQMPAKATGGRYANAQEWTVPKETGS